MIKIFKPTDTTFLSNGDKVIKATSAKVHEEDNGEYYVDIIADSIYSDWLVARNIVVVPTPNGYQPFRLTNPSKTGTKIEIRGLHVFFDTENYLIADSYVVEKDCDGAIKHLNNATEPESIFTVSSDVDTVDSYRCVREPFYNAIQVLLERWGGHLVRDAFDIQILNEIGEDNGITVEYKKNLKEIESEENWDEVCTKILPEGTDGILLNALDPSADIYMESEIQYDTPFTKCVKFDQEIEQDDYPTEHAYMQALINDLRAQATAYLKLHQIPEINYTLKADVNKNVKIGDTIEVKDRRLGIDLLTHIISYEYDCNMGRFLEIEFGNFKEKLSNLISNINANMSTQINEAINGISAEVYEKFKGSYVWDDGTKMYLLDDLPIEDAVNVLRFNQNGISSSNDGVNGTYRKLIDINGAFSALEYKNNDVINFDGQTVIGFTSSSNKKERFTVRTDKSLANITSFNVSSMKLTGRIGSGGYLFSSSYVAGGYDVVSASSLTITLTKLSDHAIDVVIDRSSGTYQGVDNMVNAIYIHDMDITCVS